MSGNQRGNPPSPPPARTFTSLRMSEPAVTSTGRLAPWLGQFLLRLADLVGTPDGSGETVSTQVTNVSNSLVRTIGQPSGDGMVEERLAALESLVIHTPVPYPPAPVHEEVESLLAPISESASLVGPLPPAPGDGCCDVAPLGALQPWLTADDIPTVAAVIYAPMVNGDLPGPVLIADPYGQCVMVPIT